MTHGSDEDEALSIVV
jgi:hypothetical protein